MRGPDRTGALPLVEAWKLKFDTKKYPSYLGGYLLRHPAAHPAWQWWAISMIHLRDIPDTPPANKRFPDATYELVVAAIDPTTCPEPDPDILSWPFMLPLDVVHQLGSGITDEQAAGLMDEAVGLVLDGYLSPDQDYRKAWEANLNRAYENLNIAKLIN